MKIYWSYYSPKDSSTRINKKIWWLWTLIDAGLGKTRRNEMKNFIVAVSVVFYAQFRNELFGQSEGGVINDR